MSLTMISRICMVLILILITPMYVSAQDEVELSLDEDYLLWDISLWEGYWESDFDDPCIELCCTDMNVLDSILLDVCLDLGMSDEDMYEMFPELYEPCYEFYLLWEDDLGY